MEVNAKDLGRIPYLKAFRKRHKFIHKARYNLHILTAALSQSIIKKHLEKVGSPKSPLLDIHRMAECCYLDKLINFPLT
ncbi:CLUMA_CG021092, isoform A [Clunio marinus]|uniref:CLUMA_CG021092, isoform A n=1 Tax=Clunio marinus TaxID=568069 RepID=A0A1J1J6M9_9DIPT|nr:CLUMA_CG021092, isoform A [Clunio marinus]